MWLTMVGAAMETLTGVAISEPGIADSETCGSVAVTFNKTHMGI